MNILILGGGESGVGAALLGKKLGYDVRLSDASKLKSTYKSELDHAGIKWEENSHTAAFTASAKLVVKSPGIPNETPTVQAIREGGAEVISEIEFAARHTTGKIVAITGTNGKTTTTLLTHHIFHKAGLDVAMAGNVGKSFARVLAGGDHAYWILEVSSFQLDDVVEFKPAIAVILNITPDHLDRYNHDFELYIAAKFAIARRQSATDHLIYGADDEVVLQALKDFAPKAELHPISVKEPVENGGYTIDNTLKINLHHKLLEMSIHELALQGKHNAYNSMAASVSARIFEIRKELVRESLSDFQNIEHRLEHVAEIHGIKFINDSKATNVNSTWYALETFSEQVVWIVGGVDKGNDYSILEPLVREKVKAIICLGVDNQKIIDYFKDIVPVILESGSASDAVAKSYASATKGDVVLLSPACASFDLFDNYEDRGQQYKRAIKAL